MQEQSLAIDIAELAAHPITNSLSHQQSGKGQANTGKYRKLRPNQCHRCDTDLREIKIQITDNFAKLPCVWVDGGVTVSVTGSPVLLSYVM